MTGALRTRALRLLTRREHTRAELARRLEGLAGAAEIAAVLDMLEREGYQSDARFAEGFLASRGRRFGPRRLRHDMHAKGVPAGIIDAALAGLGPSELERAREVWRRRFLQPPADRRDYARQARFLQGRGFGAETIRRLLREPG